MLNSKPRATFLKGGHLLIHSVSSFANEFGDLFSCAPIMQTHGDHQPGVAFLLLLLLLLGKEYIENELRKWGAKLSLGTK